MIRRIKKEKVYEDPIHSLNFLDWVVAQTENIKNITCIISELQEPGGFRRAITVEKINECLARYMEFYSLQVAFLQVYKEFSDDRNERAGELYDSIYLDIQNLVTDPTTELGKKYAKKSATMKEIDREAINHSRWGEYITLKKEARDFEKKLDAQSRFLRGFEKWDIILESLKKRDDKEFKYLYLET
jgi:hypothetical protein